MADNNRLLLSIVKVTVFATFHKVRDSKPCKFWFLPFSIFYQTDPGAHPSSCTINIRAAYRGGTAAREWRCPPSPHIASRLNTCTAILYVPSVSQVAYKGWPLHLQHFTLLTSKSLLNAAIFMEHPVEQFKDPSIRLNSEGDIYFSILFKYAEPLYYPWHTVYVPIHICVMYTQYFNKQRVFSYCKLPPDNYEHSTFNLLQPTGYIMHQ